MRLTAINRSFGYDLSKSVWSRQHLYCLHTNRVTALALSALYRAEVHLPPELSPGDANSSVSAVTLSLAQSRYSRPNIKQPPNEVADTPISHSSIPSSRLPKSPICAQLFSVNYLSAFIVCIGRLVGHTFRARVRVCMYVCMCVCVDFDCSHGRYIQRSRCSRSAPAGGSTGRRRRHER